MSDQAAGQKIGSVGGAALGTYFGGPVGGMLGGYAGNLVGGAIGGLFGGSSGPSPQQIYNDQMKAREQAAYERESTLANSLQSAANGQGPSYAGLQLGQGLDQINRSAMAQAAGTSGNGGVLARYAAMNAGAQAQAQTNQSAALARAAEITQARGQLGTVLGNQATQSNGMYGTVNGAANTANANSIALKKNDQEFDSNLLGQGLKAYGQYKALSASGDPSGSASLPLGNGGV